jgi:penicillin-binding protein 1A
MSPGDPDDRKSTPVPGPVGVEAIGKGSGDEFEPLEGPDGKKLVNRVRTREVLEPGIANTVESILQTVVKSGTATRAFVPGVTIAGKTGTTEGYGDAWFVGWTPEYTIAVWVGYPDEFKSMETEFNGQPVAGGTFPAGIFKTFVESALRIYPPKEDEAEDETDSVVPTAPAPAAPAPEATVAPETETAPAPAPAPEEPAPAPAEPAPQEAAPAPEGGGEAAPPTP